MAVSLAQLGVDCTVIDRKPGLAVGTKAAAVQPRTLEICTGWGWPHRWSSTASAVTDSPRRTATGRCCGRPTVRWTVRTVADADGGLRAIHARYVIGCDGVHSSVRQQAGIGFPGDARGQLFAVADVEFEHWSTDESDAIFYFSTDGLLLVGTLPGRQIRIGASVSDENTNLTAEDLEQLISVRSGSSPRSLRLTRVVASSTYRVQQRVAEQLSTANIFLAGDAAHTHSPTGGQGMNSGIQDAGNLAWKLHAVLSGRAAPSLLDTYTSERRPVAERVIAFTSQLTNLATLTDPQQIALRNDAIAAVAAVPNAQDWLARHMSQLDINYSQESNPDELSAGQRIPPDLCPTDDLSWTLITPDEDTIHPEGVKIIISSPRVPRQIFVRPDGYIASHDMTADIFRTGRIPPEPKPNVAATTTSA
jgi:2-polyprenyl-6-methoxyphenol hydroxylase-like FAD-dependent oxidoreductase